MGTERQRMACVEIIAPYSHRWLDKFEPGNLPPVPTSPKDPETVPVISRASSNSSEAEPEVRIVAKGWSLGSYENYAVSRRRGVSAAHLQASSVILPPACRTFLEKPVINAVDAASCQR
jgi:hypothetical protein